MEVTIQNKKEMGKYSSKLIYWWNILYHKKEVTWKTAVVELDTGHELKKLFSVM